jgi:hypothetical protein
MHQKPLAADAISTSIHDLNRSSRANGHIDERESIGGAEFCYKRVKRYLPSQGLSQLIQIILYIAQNLFEQ